MKHKGKTLKFPWRKTHPHLTFLCNNELSFYELYIAAGVRRAQKTFCSDCNCNVTTHESAIKLPNAIVRMSQHASSPPKKPRAHPVPVGQKGSKRLSPTKDVKSLWPCLSMTRHEFSAWKKNTDFKFLSKKNNKKSSNWREQIFAFLILPIPQFSVKKKPRQNEGSNFSPFWEFYILSIKLVKLKGAIFCFFLIF